MYALDEDGKYQYVPDFPPKTKWEVMCAYMEGLDDTVAKWKRDGWSLFAVVPKIINAGGAEERICEIVLYKKPYEYI